MRADFHAGFLDLMLDQRQRLLDDPVEIHLAEVGGRGAREVQQAVDDFARAER